jgi:hypothetical protein
LFREPDSQSARGLELARPGQSHNDVRAVALPCQWIVDWIAWSRLRIDQTQHQSRQLSFQGSRKLPRTVIASIDSNDRPLAHMDTVGCSYRASRTHGISETETDLLVGRYRHSGMSPTIS